MFGCFLAIVWLFGVLRGGCCVGVLLVICVLSGCVGVAVIVRFWFRCAFCGVGWGGGSGCFAVLVIVYLV